MFEFIVVILVLVITLYFLIRKFRRLANGEESCACEGKCGSSCKCASSDMSKKHHTTP